MSESQKQTVARYQSFYDTIALATSLDTARQLGVFRSLRNGQKDLQALAADCQCDIASLETLVRVLTAIGAVERYGDDLALSQAIQLMAPVDADWGAEIWQRMPAYMQGTAQNDDRLVEYRQRLVTRQWSHTAAAMQAAEVLDIGGALRGLNVLELGSGAGVWSAAMAYRDERLQVTTVDQPALIRHCRDTYASIELLDRWTAIEDDYRTWPTPLGQYDLVILPEVLQLEPDASAVVLLGRAADALRPGGQVVILETLNDVEGPSVALATQALEIAVACGGRQRTPAEVQRLLRGAGFGDAQWGWLTASPHGIGLVVATRQNVLN